MKTPPQQKTYERAVRLHNRAARCQSAGEPIRPEKLYLRSLALKEQIFGPNHLEVAVTLNNLGLYYKTLGRLPEARTAYMRSLPIMEKELGGSDTQVGDLLYNLAQLLKKEADELEQRSRMIHEAAVEASSGLWREKAVIRQELAAFDLEIGQSKIHRFGVFAAGPIPAAGRIIEYTGERVSRRYWAPRCAGRTYLCNLDKYWCLDGSIGGSGAELINHCCEPNCKFLRESGRVWVVSLRAIDPGEELLLDYNFRKEFGIVRCYCGAPSCRGTINRR